MTTLCYKVCQWLAGWWYSLGNPVSSTNKTECHNIIEMLNTINPWTPFFNFFLMKNGFPFHIPFDNLIRLLQLLYQDTGYIAFKSSSYTCIFIKVPRYCYDADFLCIAFKFHWRNIYDFLLLSFYPLILKKNLRYFFLGFLSLCRNIYIGT